MTASTETRRLGVPFPAQAHRTPRGLAVGGALLSDLAAEYGTPLYVVDLVELKERCHRYRDGLRQRRANARVSFASKAFPCTAILRAIAAEGVDCDATSGGELFVALHAGIEPERLHLHGNAKTIRELEEALAAKIGSIVIDSEDDLDRLERLVPDEQNVMLRVNPDIRGETHEANSTGQAASKFGVSFEQAPELIARLERSQRLNLIGLHVHIGSQIVDIAPFADAVARIATLGEFAVYNIGGGLGIAYRAEDRVPTIEDYLDLVVGVAERALPPDAGLVIEPGRSLIGPTAIALYTVVTVKRAAGQKLVAVDGGMSDNLDPGFYGIRPEAHNVASSSPGEPCRVVGKHCESGDVLVPDASLPQPTPGDVIAVPSSGAYTYPLWNNYNGAQRPAIITVDGDCVREVVRRETYQDLIELLQRQRPV
jgi:diaminopimelate decarboxylase